MMGEKEKTRKVPAARMQFKGIADVNCVINLLLSLPLPPLFSGATAKTARGWRQEARERTGGRAEGRGGEHGADDGGDGVGGRGRGDGRRAGRVEDRLGSGSGS